MSISSSLIRQGSRSASSPRNCPLDYAAQLRPAPPPALLADAGDPQRAVEALWALLLSADEKASARQLEVLASAYPPDTLLGVRQRRDTLAAVSPALRMPLLMRLFPALGRRPVAERQALLDLMGRVIAADGAISISEYAFARLARLHLDEQVGPPAAASELPADQLEAELQIVFSVLAHCGQGDPGFAGRAFDRGMTQVVAVPHVHYEPPSDWVPAMDRALARLDTMRLNDKARLVEGLAAVVSEDGRLDVEEAELLRAICGSLHCPLPPLMLGDGTAALAD